MRPGAAAPDRARCRPAATDEQRHCGFGRRRTPPRRLQGPLHVESLRGGAACLGGMRSAAQHAVSACGPHPVRQLPSGVGGRGAGLPPDQAEGVSHRRLQPPRSAPVPDGRRGGDRAARRHLCARLDARSAWALPSSPKLAFAKTGEREFKIIF